MAIPRVFISSTCYDLKYIRENLKYFIKTVGYDPVLSEEGTVFFNPGLDTHESCLAEVPNCQIFVLIIGGRFGTKFKDTVQSITNAEYREAVHLRIPVFALVDQSVYNDFHLFQKNRENTYIDPAKIIYPSVDNIMIFTFIDEVRSHAVNNALVPFNDFNDIESYLRQQWAAMMYSFLSSENEHSRVSDALEAVKNMNARIEMLSKQILSSVGTKEAKFDATLYEEMIGQEVIHILTYFQTRPTPISILLNSSFRSCAKSLGVDLQIEDTAGTSYSSSGRISRHYFENLSKKYTALRNDLIKRLKEHGLTPEEYVKSR